MNLTTNVTKCLHKYGLPLPGHLALRSCLIVGMDDGLDFFQVGRRQVSGNGVLDSSRGIAEGNGPGTVTVCTEQPVKRPGYIGVAAADPVHHLNIPVRLLLIVLILAARISQSQRYAAWGCGRFSGRGHNGDREFLGKALHHLPAVPVFKKVSLAVSSEQKKMST